MNEMKETIIHLEDMTIMNNGNLILEEINLEVKKGEFIFLIGKTGTGKSSLIKVLYGDLVPSKGKARVSEFHITTLKDRKIPLLRRKLGVVFQDFKLLNDRTIFKNLSFVLKATGWTDKIKIKERIEEVLKMVNVDESPDKYPFELSGGEQQRVAIGRALLNHPDIILADEPTGNLDPETSQEIMQLLQKLHQEGMTVIMATHDYNMIVKFPGKIYKCDEGKFFEVIAQK